MRLLSAGVLALVVSADGAGAQPGRTPDAPASEQAGRPLDPIGRSTPRGTVLGFLNAARRGDNRLASQFLDTTADPEAAEALAHQLYVVLDALLPPRLSQITDDTEGSRLDARRPEREVVGTVVVETGATEIALTRVDAAAAGPLWLFSRETLGAVPQLFAVVDQQRQESFLTRVLSGTRILGVRVYGWLTALILIAAGYVATVVLNRLLTPVLARLWRRRMGEESLPPRSALPLAARLLLLGVAGRWMLSALPLPLFVRQLWSTTAGLLIIVAVAWLLILLNGQIEQIIQRRMGRPHTAATALLRLLRRAADLVAIFVALFATLRLFDIDPTPALAGLGVGGIAVALAAQKTLENVIAGASLIFDQAVRVGDFLKMGEIAGTVEHIGLRSTRIRTPDRTVVSIPNSQIANASLETISARDKFWFHPVVSLSYDTTSDQLYRVIDSIRRLLETHSLVDDDGRRARFIRLGSFSLDIEVSAYLRARDALHFLELQEQLLFDISRIVESAGTRIAIPAQTMYVTSRDTPDPAGDATPRLERTAR